MSRVLSSYLDDNNLFNCLPNSYNEWKIVSDENENVYVAKNRGEDICFLYTNTSNMIDGKWVKTHCDN